MLTGRITSCFAVNMKLYCIHISEASFFTLTYAVEVMRMLM